MHHTGDAGGGGGCLTDSSQGLSQSHIVRRVCGIVLRSSYEALRPYFTIGVWERGRMKSSVQIVSVRRKARV